MRNVLGSILLGLISVPAMAAEEHPADLLARKEVLRLKPITPWNIEYADQKCRLSRMFGTTETPYLFYFEQATPNALFMLGVGGPEIEDFRGGGPVKLGFSDAAPVVKIDQSRGLTFGQLGPGVLMTSVGLPRPGQDPAAAVESAPEGLDSEAANAIERVVVARANKAVAFETGRLGPPFEALNACTADLLRLWGFDPTKPRPAKRLEPSNLRSIAKRIQENFPPGARSGESGMFNARLIVEADGTISDCTLDAATITEDLKPKACKELKGLHFKPAVGGDGKPMRWYYATTITYLTR